MTPPPTPMLPVGVGDVIHVGDDDYCYGTGDLYLRITEVGNVQHYDGGPWLNLRGLQLMADGTQILPHPRRAMVRISALRNQPSQQRLKP